MIQETELSEGEQIVTQIKPHWYFFASRILLYIVGMILMVGALLLPGNVGGWIALAIALWLVVTIGWRALEWHATTFVITTDRIMSRSGVLTRTGIEIALESIVNVRFSQSITERLVGAGDISVESANDSGSTKFDDIKNPKHIQALIHRTKEQNVETKRDFASLDATKVQVPGDIAIGAPLPKSSSPKVKGAPPVPTEDWRAKVPVPRVVSKDEDPTDEVEIPIETMRPATKPRSLSEKIREIAALRDEGVINQQDFERMSRELIQNDGS
jgi:hypothetical protein